MKAIILCAGKGERLMPLTTTIPKPMLQINNKPILEYLIMLCKKHNINEIAINTSYLPEKIKEYFFDGIKFDVKIRYSFEKELLGTAGALNNFRAFFNETFFVIYSDNIVDLNLTEMLNFHKKKKGLGTLYIYQEAMTDEKTGSGFVIVEKNDEISEVIEKPKSNEKARLKKIPIEKKFISAGIYVLEPEILKLIPQGFSDFPKDIFPKALQIGKLFGFKENCYFKEVGQLMRYKQAKEDIETGKVKFDFV